jgi:rare lipoprotein A
MKTTGYVSDILPENNVFRKMKPMNLVKKLFLIILFFVCRVQMTAGQDSLSTRKIPKVLYGTASFYADKFNGRKTANGEIFSQQKMTAACNVLPLGMWIRVTNLRNGRSIVVKVNDRLHIRMKRVVDLSKAGARQLGYAGGGLTKVKVEPLGFKKHVIK